jgi:tyrosyl-tRNA synthetase
VSASAIIDDLLARRLIQDHTDLDALRERLERGPMTLYVGFDPTAESLHIGNLVPLLLLRRFQLAGHLPIALAGGATGMIGDPGGRSEERNLLDGETLDRNTRAIKAQLSAFLDFEPGPCQARLVDNRDWTAPMGVLDFLRDVGKHVTVNYMLAKESVRSRVASEHGISFTEFSYMLLQAHDYAWLNEQTNCELQAGGSDQWGNITAGIDLVRRRTGASVHGLTVPLVTRSDGEKFGKSVDGALWLDPERTSPYALYQYFVNLADDDVERYLLQLTLVPVEEARRVAAEHAQAPERRAGQQRLAWEMTALILGRATRGAQRRDPDDALRARRPRGRRPAGREQARGQQGRGAPPDRRRRHLRQRRRARRGTAAQQRRSPARPLRDAAQGQAPAAPARLEREVAQQERSGVTASTLSSTTWMRPLASRRRPPWRPVRVPTISARMEIAVSSGVWAPMSSPTGPAMRSSCSSVTPEARRRSRRFSCVRREPSAPT